MVCVFYTSTTITDLVDVEISYDLYAYGNHSQDLTTNTEKNFEQAIFYVYL